YGDAALRRTVELREDDAVHAGRGHELAGLDEPVLSDRRIEDEQRLLRGARHLAAGDAADLLELVHQVDARVQPAGRVDEHRVAPLRLRRRDRIEDDGGGIGALAGAYDVDAGARRPD